MRVDGIAPRTWLLATLAGWALLAWLLALAGMGGHASVLAADAGLLRPLPQPGPETADRLGPLSGYGEIGARPLFADDRRPHPFSLQAGNADDPGDDGFDYMLTGVLITPRLRMAIVQPSRGGDSVRIKLDGSAEQIPAWRLVQLDARSAVFEGPQGRKRLQLRVYDGTGGSPPTPQHDAGAAGDDDASANPDVAAAPAARPMSQAAPISQARDPGDAAASGDDRTQDSASQMEAIRKRIEARRAQMREDASNRTVPAKKP